MAAAARAVLYQLQRLDAFLLDVLYQNVYRMQGQIHGVLPSESHGEPTRTPNVNYNGDVLTWSTNEGFQRLSLSDHDAVALQVAPWTFITSPYWYSLIIMAILLNRIQHIVVPTHDPPAGRLGSWLSKVLPINASATPTRFLLRSVSLYLLWKSTVVMGAIALLAFGVFPDIRPLASLKEWALTENMVDVCWSSFLAVCVAMAISTFTRGLDGSGPSGPSSFNLPQFAFMLHLYSSPLGRVFNKTTDAYQGQVPALRPNRHVLVTMFLPLLQMTMIHTQGIWKRYQRDVLVPTSICGLIALVHFIYILSIGQVMDYPLLQVVPASLELFLIGMIACTTGLNALSQFLLQGAVTRPLFTGAGSLPSWDEEYAVALVRLGTSSIEATSAAGLGNEVASVSSKSLQEGTVRLGPAGVTTLELPKLTSTRKRKRTNPFAIEIKNVKAASTDGETWISITWMKEMGKLGVSLWRFTKGVWIIMRRKASRRNTSSSASPTSAPGRRAALVLSKQGDLYQRFLAGEAISDQESEFDGDDNTSDTTEDTEDEGLMDHGSVNSEEQDIEETGQLYSEHGSQRASTPLAPVLLAHLTTPSGTPLTRRRYSSLLTRKDVEEDVGIAVSSRTTSRMNQVGTSERDGERAVCVICMSSERVVICWPCRCLSMCDDCRSNLASRHGPSRHSCPCCQQTVEGYSRIFIP